MIEVTQVHIDGRPVRAVTVELPKTRLVILATDVGYLMCGALDVELFNTKLAARQVVAGRALGVRTYQDLLEMPLESVTQAAERLGIHAGMSGRDALRRLLAIADDQAAWDETAAADGRD